MLFQPQKLTMPFDWFPQFLSISGHRINESKAISSRSLCQGCSLTKFRGFENRTVAHFFTMLWRPLKFVAFNFRSKDAEPFGSNKKYLNIETSPLFWTCLQISSMLNVLYERGGSCTSVQLCISGSGGRAHPGESRTVLLGSYRFQVVPICSTSIQ